MIISSLKTMVYLFENAGQMLEMWVQKLNLMGFDGRELIYGSVEEFYEEVGADLAEFLFVPPQGEVQYVSSLSKLSSCPVRGTMKNMIVLSVIFLTKFSCNIDVLLDRVVDTQKYV